MEDVAALDGIVEEVFKGFEGVDKDEVFREPVICTSFITLAAGAEKQYIPVKSKEELSKILNEKLEE